MQISIGPTGHTLLVPTLVVDPTVERLEKLEKYYRHHNVQRRYKLLFKEFVAKVDAGTWNAYLAEGGTQ